MVINYLHPDLTAVQVLGRWVEPSEAVQALASGEADIADVRRVRIFEDTWSWAKAWQTQPVIDGRHQYHRPDGFRIGAGAYGDLTVIRAGAIG